MKRLSLFALLVVAACTPSNPAGPKTTPPGSGAPQASTPPTGTDIGNGGDHARSTFLRVGEAVLNYLDATSEGRALVIEHGLDLKALRATLDVKRIKVVDHALKDNNGSDVDALGEPGQITLRQSRWIEHFEKLRDVYYLVFHEMLRSAAIPDDNYVISGKLNPFPTKYAISTKLVPLLPLVTGELLSGLLYRADIKWAGSGCPVGAGYAYADFNYETNVMELSFTGYRMEHDGVAALAQSRRNCNVSVPVTTPAGHRLIVTQADLNGTMSLPSSGEARLSFEGYRAGVVGKQVTREYKAPEGGLTGRFQLRSNITFGTACGTPGILNIASSAIVPGTEGAVTKFEIDRIALYLKLERCE